MRNLILILFALTLISCFDENSFVIKPIPIDEFSVEVKIPYSMYEDQTFFSLNDTAIVSHNNYANWDLGFEATPTGYHIILNSTKFMYAGNTGLTDFSSVITNVADTMMFDRSSGNLDSTAIGNWADFTDALNPVFLKKVYIINRGVDESGTSLGFKKIIFEKLENNTYFIHYANLDNSDDHTYQVPKNTAVNFVQFSFEDGGNLNTQQPNKDLWDLDLTKYSTILYDQNNNNKPTPYLVRGVLINSGVSVAKDTVNSYSSINISNIDSYTFSSKQDAIGFDWKKYINGEYVIIGHYNYIIKDSKGNYFKLRFTGYKNTISGDIHYGVKGYPSFEMSKLNY
jgi:hypothetical protein